LSTKRTGAKALALLAGSSLALTACATSDPGTSPSASGSASATTAPITFTWGYEQEFASYNNNTSEQNASANAVVLNQVLRGFWYFAPDGKIVRDTEFGTFEKTSDAPLTVKYKFNEKAAWSDGEPIDCDDAVLFWLGNSGKAPADANGKNGFSSAGTTGYENQQKPQCKDKDKEFTVVYDTPFADWESMYGGFQPAHILEKQAGVTDIIAAADDPKGADSLKAAAFWNKGWELKPGTLKPELTPSAGPYTISAWSAGQSLTLEANPKWWGTPALSKNIVIRIMGGDTMTQALQNGEINAMDPQPQRDLVEQLKKLGDKVKVSNEDQYTYEHFTFNFKSPVMKDLATRQAFAKCIPRQQIIDNLIKPVNPNAKIQQSRAIFPFQPEYADFENSIGGEKYNEVDIEGAKALLKGATPTVRIGWRKDPQALNKRRVDEVALVTASCAKAGFKVEDTGAPDFFENAWPKGNFDVGMFAWSSSPLVTASTSTYTTGGGNNNGKYSNPAVDADLKALGQETDKAKQIELVKKIETQLWTDLHSVPVFAFPGILATSPNAEGVEFNATQAGLTWNASKWSLKQ